jgi:hypothetical protein
MSLGSLTLHNCLGIDLATYGQFLKRFGTDYGVVGEAVSEAFIVAVNNAGVRFGGGWPGA